MTTETVTKSTPSTNGDDVSSAEGARGYAVPFVHVTVPEYLVEGGFWGGLAGAALVGAINPPLALAIGAGVVIARHRNG